MNGIRQLVATALEYGPREFLHEKRIALRLAQDRLGQGLRQFLDGDGSRQRQALRRGERPERELGRVRLIRPRRPGAGTRRRHEQDRNAGEAVRQRGEVLFGALVDPVEVLDDENDWSALRAFDARLAQGPRCPRLGDVWRTRGKAR